MAVRFIHSITSLVPVQCIQNGTEVHTVAGTALHGAVRTVVTTSKGKQPSAPPLYVPGTTVPVHYCILLLLHHQVHGTVYHRTVIQYSNNIQYRKPSKVKTQNRVGINPYLTKNTTTVLHSLNSQHKRV